MNNPQQPREYDAVLGSNITPEGTAVLGGIEGVKLRLKNPDIKVRITALRKALNYGEQGLDLVIQALQDENMEVQHKAYAFLIYWKEKQQSLLISRNQKQQQLNSDLLRKIKNFVFSDKKYQEVKEQKHQNFETIEKQLVEKVDQALSKLIDDVKYRLKNIKNEDLNVRFSAFEQALNYGKQGLDLVIQSLKDESLEVQRQTYSMFNYRTNAWVRQGLIESDGYLRMGGSTDYTHLRDYLAQGKWKEADVETERVMLVVAKREKECFLDVEDINNFPCEDLYTIDQLWLKYSNRRFGFFVQKFIYQGIKSDWDVFDYDEIKNQMTVWADFTRVVGWGLKPFFGVVESKRYKELTFDITAPEGHLPAKVYMGLLYETPPYGLCLSSGWKKGASLLR